MCSKACSPLSNQTISGFLLNQDRCRFAYCLSAMSTSFLILSISYTPQSLRFCSAIPYAIASIFLRGSPYASNTLFTSSIKPDFIVCSIRCAILCSPISLPKSMPITTAPSRISPRSESFPPDSIVLIRCRLFCELPGKSQWFLIIISNTVCFALPVSSVSGTRFRQRSPCCCASCPGTMRGGRQSSGFGDPNLSVRGSVLCRWVAPPGTWDGTCSQAAG